MRGVQWRHVLVYVCVCVTIGRFSERVKGFGYFYASRLSSALRCFDSGQESKMSFQCIFFRSVHAQETRSPAADGAVFCDVRCV